MTKIFVRGEFAFAEGPFNFQLMKLIATLPGRKKWEGQKNVRFDATRTNLDTVREGWHDIEIVDETNAVAAMDELANMATQHTAVKWNTKYEPNLPLKKYQQHGVALARGREAYAYLLEMGLGKTAMAICDMAILHTEFGARGAIVFTKKGVDEQWVESEIPKHINKKLRYQAYLWKGKTIDFDKMKRGMFHILVMNTDSVRTDRGYDTAVRFIKSMSNDVVIIVDESHDIKNITAARSRAMIMLGQMCKWRRIMTGTPISKNIVDAFSQFYFLDPNILGHKYLTSFRARYCIMGGYEGRQIVGQRRVEEFYSLIASHSYRLTKAEALDLPPKNYVTVPYIMGPVTSRHYESLKKTMLTQLSSGDVLTVANAVTLTVKLQQLICGYLVKEGGEVEEISDERIEVLQNIIEQVTGPVVIWARFQRDVERITSVLEKEYGKGCCSTYYGKTKKGDRKESVADFMSGKSRFFVATTGAGGTGLNLQGKCQNVIYYSNDFNALARWQSEDRTHRIGTTDKVTYFDIVAAKTVDKTILLNLKGKKSISDLSLDQIRQMLVG